MRGEIVHISQVYERLKLTNRKGIDAHKLDFIQTLATKTKGVPLYSSKVALMTSFGHQR